MYISGPVTGENFVNREQTLDALRQHAEDRQYCSLIGLRRTGKTSLMIKTMGYLPPKWVSGYFNVQNSIAVPEQFAVTYVGSILFWVLHGQGLVSETTQPHFFDLHYVQRQALLLKDQQVSRYLLDMADALDRREVNYTQVLTQAFSFPQTLSEVLNRPLAIFIDEFQDIVQMDAYGIDSLKIFRSITQMQTGVWSGPASTGSTRWSTARIHRSLGSTKPLWWAGSTRTPLASWPPNNPASRCQSRCCTCCTTLPVAIPSTWRCWPEPPPPSPGGKTTP